eukprot:Amastigsp_a845595_4.p2 type:complete len:126 gc:universal Amastigsp_a845595_4:312-689(+)
MRTAVSAALAVTGTSRSRRGHRHAPLSLAPELVVYRRAHCLVRDRRRVVPLPPLDGTRTTTSLARDRVYWHRSAPCSRARAQRACLWFGAGRALARVRRSRRLLCASSPLGRRGGRAREQGRRVR